MRQEHLLYSVWINFQYSYDISSSNRPHKVKKLHKKQKMAFRLISGSKF